MDKYVNTNGFDMNQFDAERVAFRESQEKAERIANEPSFKAASDLKDIERQKSMDNYFREQDLAEERRAIREQQRKFLKEQELKDAQIKAKEEFEKEQERQRHLQEYKDKQEAVKKAYERYKQHSVFYRMFHKSVLKMNRRKMSVEQINGLYGGRSK